MPVRASTRHDCGNGVQLSISVPEAAQGSLLLVEVRSANALASVQGQWDGKEVSFWQARSNRLKSQNSGFADVRRALLGVDLEKPPGEYELSMTLQTESGSTEPKQTESATSINCKAFIPVVEGKFATERLHVDTQFVEPSPEQSQRAKAESEKLKTIYATTTPEKLWHGSFRIPLDGAKTGSNFGKRRILNGESRSPHGGADFPAPTGTPVHAAQAGRVVLAEPFFFSGNTVVVDHGLGLYTFYCHFSEISVKVGDAVEKGTVLGKVGATGRVTGPHLHWGLTVHAARVNPVSIVKMALN